MGGAGKAAIRGAQVILKTVDLWKRYGRHEVLTGLSLSVPQGSAYAFIGANGAGKTTTIRILMNLIRAEVGEALVLDCDSRALNPQVLSRIGYVSENQRLPSGLSVGAYLAYLHPFYPGWDGALEKELLAQFELPQESRIGDLSHGMGIKLALTAALAYRPELLVLDEPFSGIDPLVRDELMEGLARQAGDTTIFISSHELSEIEGLVSHVGYLEGGRMRFEEAVEDMNARFRQIDVILQGDARLPEGMPGTWLTPRAVGNVLSFVDSHYREDELQARLSAAFSDIRRIETKPVPLRQVFTSMARSARKGG
jgi:ABC-type multidrug transport system, ATPase component